MNKIILNVVIYFSIILMFVQCQFSESKSSKLDSRQINKVNSIENQLKSIDTAKNFIKKLQNRKPIQFNKNFIFGEWEDQNSLLTYQNDFKFFGTFDKYQLKQQELGTFQIKNDTLIMNFTSIKHNPEYIIIEVTNNTFTIQSIDDGAIFYKIRTK